MRRTAALTLIAFAVAAPFTPSAARASQWNCLAESKSGSASATEASRQEAEDRALANCASISARFAICKIVKCQRVRGHS
jgi:hypothetical protein